MRRILPLIGVLLVLPFVQVAAQPQLLSYDLYYVLPGEAGTGGETDLIEDSFSTGTLSKKKKTGKTCGLIFEHIILSYFLLLYYGATSIL